ncbi:45 kDa calcium-binding protein [Ananas comosus]|uniref:45 kDa calcium-binding protein n=1 Tax=Ananas comosus TaxID=4615 RepID=A0A199VEB9_ANACO|nr:45 kDa calcium-binding protein [Ananas comosus]
MAKSSASVLVIYVAVALFLLFLLASYSPKNPNLPRQHHRRLKLRSNFSSVSSSPPSPSSSSSAAAAAASLEHSPIPFDPVIASLERRFEDREWEREHYASLHGDGDKPGKESLTEWEDFMKAEEYINDEDRFNITDRIALLFPKIDVGPRRWLLCFTNSVTFDFRPDNSSVGWWRQEHFNAADMDGNGLLNKTEFNDFLHPADSKNPKLIQWLCKEELRERDKDRDGKLNFLEFLNGLYDSVRDLNEVHDHSDAMTVVHGKKIFEQLDLDGDGFLSEAEIEPVLGKLHPSEHYYAKEQANYVISLADEDKDGRLSLKEMTEHPYAFYSTIFNEEDDDFYHDEFR